MKIPYLDLNRIHEPIRPELDQTYHDIMNRQWFIHGQYCAKFEEEFAQYCGVEHCIGVGNGLDLQVSCVEQKQSVLNALAVHIIRQSLSCFFFKECGKITGILI